MVVIDGKLKPRKKSARFVRKSAKSRDDDESLNNVQVDPSLSRGMVDILVQTTRYFNFSLACDYKIIPAWTLNVL